MFYLTACSSQPTNVMFAYTYQNSMSAKVSTIKNVINQFTHDLQLLAPHVKVGVVSQPCAVGSMSLMNVRRFRSAVSEVNTKLHSGFAGVVRKLRTEIFSNVPLEEKRVAVLFVDENTQNLNLLEEEVHKLRLENVQIVVVSVGDVQSSTLDSLVSDTGNVITVDSYASLESHNLSLFDLVCNRHQFTASYYNHIINSPVVPKSRSGHAHVNTLPPLPIV